MTLEEEGSAALSNHVQT